MRKNLPAKAGHTGDVGSIPGSGRYPRGRNGNPLHCSCLGSPTHRGGAWRATVQEVTASRTRLNDGKHVQHDQAFRVLWLEKSSQKYYKCRFLGQPPEFQFSWCIWGPPNLHFYKHPADLHISDSVL